MTLRARNRPDSCKNLEWLFQYCEPDKLRQSNNGVRMQQRELARALGVSETKVSRLISVNQLAPWEYKGVAAFFKLNELEGFAESMLVLPHHEFQRKMLELGFGKMVGPKDGSDWFFRTAKTTGYFVPEEHLSMMRGVEVYRGLGLDNDEPIEIPNATCHIGRYYGIAVELEEPVIALAVRTGSAYGVLIHRDRSTRETMALTTDGDTELSVVPWIFVKPAVTPADTDLPRLALLAERTVRDGVPRLGYRVNGTPGRRDVFIFLFARRPKLGPDWQTDGKLLDAPMSHALKAAVEDAQAGGEVCVRRIVYDAIPA